jgi:hypothetical protein
MPIISLFIWLLVISIIFTTYGKIAERLGNFRPGSYYVLLLLGAFGGGAFLFILLIIFELLPYEFVLNSYILIGSTVGILVRFIIAFIYINRKKISNRFQIVAVSVIISTGFLIVENYINLVFLKNYIFSRELLILPAYTVTSVVMGYYLGKSGTDFIKGGIAAILINCVYNYTVALLPIYSSNAVYLLILVAMVILASVYTIIISHRAFIQSV